MNTEPSARNTIIAFVMVVIVIIIGIVALLASRPEPVQITINPPQPTGTPEPTHTPSPITVYITGAVNEPQTTVSLPSGSRVQDAIDAAGGLSDAADLDRVNLAGIVRDGDQVHVPEIGDDTVVDVVPTASGGGIVHINTATADELATLPGIGPATAQAILEYRDTNGPFESMEDLDLVPGIGPATLERLEGLIVFD